MPTIKELKEDLQFNTELIELLEVMKNTAIFQFRAMQSRKERFDKFFKAVEGFFPVIGGHGSGNPLMAPASSKEAIIMVTSDEGFMGSLNSQVINMASQREAFKEAELIIVGERGARYLKEMNWRFTPFKGAADTKARRALAANLTGYVIDGVKKGKFGRVLVLYPKPISFLLQRVEAIEMLPIAAGQQAGTQELIMESPVDGIIDYLAEELTGQRLVDILEDSKIAEFAARAIHLENSSRELEEKKKKIRLQYFRAHHEMIDKSTRELFAAQITIRKS